MSEPHKAVFLSYASQDAEAARRICESLRAGGVEVWFDVEGGLEHGDEWDAKIRRQIKECVLFIPVISANTQARHEGYFRIEWDLAAERARGIASGVAFILPVVIDDTREPAALVPDRFRAVQWTKLPGGVVTPEVKARYLKLWSHRAGVLQSASVVREASAAQAAPAGRSGRTWLVGGVAAAVLLVASVMIFQWRRSLPPPDTALRNTPAATPSETDSIVKQARELIYDPDSARNEFALAENLLKRATDLAPNSGTAWGASALLNHYFYSRGYDSNRQRLVRSQAEAEKALRLDSRNTDALLALGLHRRELDEKDRARDYFERALAADPQNFKAVIGRSLLVENFTERANFLLDAARTSKRPAELFYYASLNFERDENYEASRVAVDRAIAAQPFWRAFVQRAEVEAMQTASSAKIDAWLDRVPELKRDEPRVAFMRSKAAMFRHDGAAALRALNAIATDYFDDNFFIGPKAYLLAQALEQAGRPKEALEQWTLAERVLREKLAAEPGTARWRPMLAVALASQNRGAEARALADIAAADDRVTRNRVAAEILADAFARLGEPGKAIALLGQDVIGSLAGFVSAATLAADPAWDSLRAHPDYAPLVTKLKRREAAANSTSSAVAKPEEKSAVAEKTAAADKSVAVLAFKNLSGDPAREFFSDGLSDVLADVLARVPGLRVTASASAFSFKGKNVAAPEMARQLGVSHLVEGTVRQEGQIVRITVKLIQADGFQVWASDPLQHELKNIFALHDEVAALVAKHLSLKLGVAAASPIVVNTEAYQHLLQARFFSRGDTNEGWRRSIDEYKAALLLEPNLAPAWAEMARCYIQLARFSGLGLAEAFAGARTAAERAVSIAPQLAEAQNAMGWVQRTVDWDWQRAEASFRRAYELSPGNAGIICDYAIIQNNTGRFAEAIELGRRALELDPLNASTRANLSLFLGWAGRYDEAAAEMQRAIAFAPTATEWHAYLARFELLRGRVDAAAAAAEAEVSERYRLVLRALVLVARKDRAAADRVIQEVIERYGDREAGYIAEYYAWAGERDLAFTWLERARERRETIVIWILGQRTLDALHTDPRWLAFLRKIGFAGDQLK